MRKHNELQSRNEELANSITHGIGAFLSLIALVSMLYHTILYNDIWHIIGCGIFGVSLVMLYSASTLYHYSSNTEIKKAFRLLDHSCIYLLIGGTYTPFALTILRNGIGFTLLSIIWTMALIGIILKIFFVGRYNIISTLSYIVMGWMAIIAAETFIQAMPLDGIIFIVLGGLAYTLGAVFYLLDKLPYFHTIWHCFVLLGSICHFTTVWKYIIH